MSDARHYSFDVAIVGGGPAGLTAAITLGRALRRVVVFDHGRPRNQVARGVHCFLGHDGIRPADLRLRGRLEAQRYGAELVDAEVVDAASISDGPCTAFRLRTLEAEFTARMVLFATGVVDKLPEIAGLKNFYGRSVHHCPYCDGWEHRGQRLVALGNMPAAIKLASTLRNWSSVVTLCSNGTPVDGEDEQFLRGRGVELRSEPIERLDGVDGVLHEVRFADGSRLPCDAVFFSSGQGQRSILPARLGCDCDERDLIQSQGKQCTSVEGVYIAGDADGDTQFAITAAAEGAVAAVAIDNALRAQDCAGALQGVG